MTASLVPIALLSSILLCRFSPALVGDDARSGKGPTLSKTVQECGTVMLDNADQGAQERMLNGTPTTPSKWPWMVSLVRVLEDGTYWPFCGGSIVGDRYVLTAAHCLCRESHGSGCVRMKAPDYVVFNVSDYGDRKPRIEWNPKRVEAIYTHPNAFCLSAVPKGCKGPKTCKVPKSCGNDVALVKLKEPYVFGRFTQPICLSNSEVDEEGKEVFMIGYSTDKDKDSSGHGILRVAKTALIRYENCERNLTAYFTNKTHISRRDSICTLGFTPPNKNSCSIITSNGTCLKYGQFYYGDSGSPMQVQMNGRWTQLGVVSWGSHVGAPSAKEGTVLPDVFARVSTFCGWMKVVSKGEVKCLGAADPLSGYKPFECGKQRPIDCYYPAICAYRGEQKEQCVGKIGVCSSERCWDGEYECVKGQFCFEKPKGPTPTPPKPVQQCGVVMINNVANLRSSATTGAHVAEERILNGTPTAPSKWPWMVSLVSVVEGGSYISTCGGSIVGDRYVLTAAHCLCKGGPGRACSNMTSPDYVVSNVSNYGDRKPRFDWIQKRVEAIYTHPDAFCRDAVPKDCKGPRTCEVPQSCGNDVALLKMTDPYTFGPWTQPICLSNSVVDEEGKEVFIIGYSTDKDKDFSSYGILREAKTALIRYENCERNLTSYFTNKTHISRRDSICTLGFTPPNKNSCSIITSNGTCLKYGQVYYGDTGSPMQVQRNGHWMQLGLVSWGSHVGAPSAKVGTVLPDVFARVSSFCKWMKEVSNEEVKCLPMAG